MANSRPDTTVVQSADSPQATKALLALIGQHLAGSQLRRNFMAGSGLTIASLITTAISYRVYLHFLGFELYGLWLSLGFVLTLAQFGNVGITGAVTKIVAEENGRGDSDAVRAYVTTAVLTLLVTGVILFISVLLSRHALLAGMRLKPAYLAEALTLLPWMSLLSVYSLQVEALNSVVYGMGRMDLGSLIGFSARVLVFVLATALLLLGHGVFALLAANVVGAVAAHTANIIVIRRISGRGLFRLRAFDVQRLRKMMTFSAGAFACSIVGMFLNPFNKYMLTRYAGLAVVPVYDIAMSLAMQARGLLDGGLRAIMPEVSRLNGIASRNSLKRIGAIHDRSLRLVLALGAFVFVPALLLAGLVLKTWLGARFHPLMPGSVRVLLAANFISLIGVPAYYALFAIGRLQTLIISQGIQAGLNVMIVGGMIVAGQSLAPLHAAVASGFGLIAASGYLLFAWRTSAAIATPKDFLRSSRASSIEPIK